jgi:hypothetical protein
MNFWSKRNPAMLKRLATQGVPQEWLERDWLIAIERAEVDKETRKELEKTLAEAQLGEMASHNTVLTSRKAAHWAQVLVIDVLRFREVPKDTIVRSGFPNPTTAMAVYPPTRKSNLLKIAARSTPNEHELFAYSFDSQTFWWGVVAAMNTAEPLGDGLLLLYFLRTSTPEHSSPELVDTRDLLIPPLLTDDSCWKRGLFARGRKLQAGETIPPTHCFEQRSLFGGRVTYVDQNGEPCERSLPVGNWAIMSWSSVDAELSVAHDIPLLGPD